MTEETKLPDLNLQVGDEVEAFGVKGVVTNNTLGSKYPIIAIFEGRGGLGFTADGRLHTWHKTPSLKLIKRKPKTVEKTVELKRYLLQDKEDTRFISWTPWIAHVCINYDLLGYKILKTETMTETYTEEE